MTDVINNFIELINKIVEAIDHVICEMYNDTIHLIDGKLNKIIARVRKKLEISPENKAE